VLNNKIISENAISFYVK